MQYSYFSVISASSSPGLFFLEGKALGTRLHFWVPIQNGRSFSKLFLQFSRNFPSRVENISTLEEIFRISARPCNILYIVTCDQAIFFFFFGGGKKQYFPRQKEKIADRRLPLLKRACFGSWLTERGILLLRRACFALWLIERGILHFKSAN